MQIQRMIFLSVCLLLLNACGKAESNDDDNRCEYRYVYGKECIVCEKGGVSCKW